jgi:hypothetical protein
MNVSNSSRAGQHRHGTRGRGVRFRALPASVPAGDGGAAYPCRHMPFHLHWPEGAPANGAKRDLRSAPAREDLAIDLHGVYAL